VSVSVHAYFQEVEAVVDILDGWIRSTDPDDRFASTGIQSDVFTAIWQSAELLARAYQVLIPMIQFDLSKQALNLPDSYEKPSGLVLPDTPLPGMENL